MKWKLLVAAMTLAGADSGSWSPRAFAQYHRLRAGRPGQEVFWHTVGSVVHIKSGRVLARMEGVETIRCDACVIDKTHALDKLTRIWNRRRGVGKPVLLDDGKEDDGIAFGLASTHKIFAFYDVAEPAKAPKPVTSPLSDKHCDQKPRLLMDPLSHCVSQAPRTIFEWVLSPLTISPASFRPSNPRAYRFSQVAYAPRRPVWFGLTVTYFSHCRS